MSTIDRPKPDTLPPLEAGQRLDRATFHARYEAMPSRTRAELIGGVVYMPSPLGRDHGDLTSVVGMWLNLYRRQTPGLKASQDSSVFLADDSETQPDLHLRRRPEYGGRTQDTEDDYIAGPPELVVELSRSSRKIDLGPKFDDYERTGVLEYVVIALDPNEVFWFVRREGRFEQMTAGPDGIFRSEIFPGLWLDAKALYADDLDGLIRTLNDGLASPEHAEFVARLRERRGGADPSGGR